jgi:hypothetical protein
MPNAIKYSLSAQTLALKKGNFFIGTGDVGKGPTSTTDYYNGITPPSEGYTIYLNKASQGPSIYCPTNNAALISLSNTIAGQTFTTAADALVWFATQTDKMVFNIDYESIITNGLTVDADAGFTPSYPTTGTTWYNLSSLNSANNGTLTNGPTYSSTNSGIINLDGVDDFINFGNDAAGATQCTVSVWVRTTSAADGTKYILGWGNSGPFVSQTNIGVLNGGSQAFIVCRDNTPTITVQVNSTGFTLNDGVWHNLVSVRNGRTVSFYIDGSLNNSGTAGSNFGSFASVPIYLGQHPGLPETAFNGSISNFLVYDSTALSAAQVLQNYNAQKSRFLSIVTDSLIMNLNAGNTSSYPGTGTLWTDLSGQNNNATLVNGPTFSSSNGGVISFDGTNDSGQWASGGAITANLNTWYNDTTRTLQMWINFSNLNSGQLQSITSLGDDEVQYGFAISNSRWAMFANSSFSTIGNALSTNTWYFVTLLRTGADSWTIYQGTTNLGNVTQFAGISSFGGDYQFQLMCNGYGNHKQGTVGQVLFYSKVLSASEIANNYDATKSRFGL